MPFDKPAILALGQISSDLELIVKTVGRDYSVQEMSTPDALYAQALENFPELVILDLAFPGGAALTLLDRLAAEERLTDLAILLLAKSGKEAEASAALERGATDILGRPLFPNIVKARIFNTIAQRNYRRLLRRIVAIDPVTGIGNRRRFDEFLDLEWRRNLRNRTSLSLVLMDLDHFKTFEGRYGRSATENTLLRVAEAVAGCLLRAGDMPSRLEGGKFACILPETDTVGAVAVGERMRAAVASLQIPHAASKTEPTLTASLGVVTRVPSVHDSLEALADEVERRLTQAKARGRNQVIFG